MSKRSSRRRDLQKRRTAAGPLATGKEAVLAKRLADKEGAEEQHHTVQDEDEIGCDAILVSTAKTGDEGDMCDDARNSLGKALEEEDLYVESDENRMFIANLRGLTYARMPGTLERMENQIAAKNKKYASLKQKFMETEQQNSDLLKRVDILKHTAEGHSRVRNRFISSFKHNKLHSALHYDHRIIRDGNTAAHGGNAEADAMLYCVPAGRRDVRTFEHLYGLLPETVLKIRHAKVIDLLNKHATVRASKYQSGSETFYNNFTEFIRLFKESGEGYEEDFLSGADDAIAKAYRNFFDSLETEVTDNAEED